MLLYEQGPGGREGKFGGHRSRFHRTGTNGGGTQEKDFISGYFGKARVLKVDFRWDYGRKE